MEPAQWLRSGRVGRPHGLDGSFHVTQPNPLLLDAGATVRLGERELRIVRRAGTDRQVILRLDGFATREDAEAVRGADLLVARSQAPELQPDEWWAEDLEGCAVLDGGRRIGTVRRLLSLPSCEVLEVARAEGQGEILVPLVSDAVREVDIEHKRIEINFSFLGEA